MTAISHKLLIDRHTVSRILKKYGIEEKDIQIRRKSTSGNDKNKIILQYDKNNRLIKEWESLSEAARQLKLASSNICKVLKGERKTCGNFIWRYKESN